MNTKLTGAMGEAYAAEVFRKKHYEILGMNYRTPFGELDLIAAKGKRLLFVEVKLRKAGGLLRAADAVGRAKQERLRASAELWLAAHPQPAARSISFAVAEIYTSADGRIERFSLMENAF